MKHAALFVILIVVLAIAVLAGLGFFNVQQGSTDLNYLLEDISVVVVIVFVAGFIVMKIDEIKNRTGKSQK